MNIASLTNAPAPIKTRWNQTLDQAAFLRLMTAQLQNQDPTDPVDNQAFVAQTAQFSSLAGITELNTSLRGIAAQLSEQTALLQDIKAARTAPVI